MDTETDERDKIAVKIFTTVVEASKDGGEVTVVKTGMAFDALMMVAAVIMANSEECRTPRAVGELCETVSKNLRRQILAAQRDPRHAEVFYGVYKPDLTH